MEELCYRFPVLGKLLLKNLDEQSLSNCQEASRVVNQFVIKERFFWIRIIQKYYKKLREFKRSWNVVIQRTPAGILKQLAIALHHFLKRMQSTYAAQRSLFHVDQWSPFHVAADSGLMSLCTHVYGNADIYHLEDKNPGNKNGFFVSILITPLNALGP